MSFFFSSRYSISTQTELDHIFEKFFNELSLPWENDALELQLFNVLLKLLIKFICIE